MQIEDRLRCVGNNNRKMVRLKRKKDEPEKRAKIVESTHNETMNKTNNIKLRIIE